MLLLTQDKAYRKAANTERESKMEENWIFPCNLSKRETCFLSNLKISPMKYSLPSLKSLCASSVFASTGGLLLWGFWSLGELPLLLHAQWWGCWRLLGLLQPLLHRRAPVRALMAEMLCPEVWCSNYLNKILIWRSHHQLIRLNKKKKKTDTKTSAYRVVLCWPLLDFKRLVSSHEQTTVHLLLLWQAPFLQRDWWWWLLLSWPILCTVFKLNDDRHHNSSKEIWCETPLLCGLGLPFPLFKFCNLKEVPKIFWVTEENLELIYHLT